MIKLFAILIFWTLPWNPTYLINLYSIDFSFECRSGVELAGYAGNTNTIIICPAAIKTYGQLKRVVIHESQHHMQLTECTGCGPGGWVAFERAAVMVVKNGDYTEHQRRSILAHVGNPVSEPWYNLEELHAELPNILGLDIPEPLCPWYPWFCKKD